MSSVPEPRISSVHIRLLPSGLGCLSGTSLNAAYGFCFITSMFKRPVKLTSALLEQTALQLHNCWPPVEWTAVFFANLHVGRSYS
jgi:hypothetical protein